MKTTTVNLYQYSELTDEAKEKARRWLIDGKNYDDMPEAMRVEIENLLEQSPLETIELGKVYYSLGYSQGDGAMFEGIFKLGKNTFHVEQSGHYYHYNSKSFQGHNENGEEVYNEKTDDAFNNVYSDLCRKLEKYGYAYIEYEQSEEVIAGVMEANGYTFEADGTRRDKRPRPSIN